MYAMGRIRLALEESVPSFVQQTTGNAHFMVHGDKMPTAVGANECAVDCLLSDDCAALEMVSVAPPHKRRLEFRRGNLFDVSDELAAMATVVVLATDFPSDILRRLPTVLDRLPASVRLLTYCNLIPDVYASADACPFIRIAPTARFKTNWSPAYQFLIWQKRPAFSYRSSSQANF